MTVSKSSIISVAYVSVAQTPWVGILSVILSQCMFIWPLSLFPNTGGPNVLFLRCTSDEILLPRVSLSCVGRGTYEAKTSVQAITRAFHRAPETSKLKKIQDHCWAFLY